MFANQEWFLEKERDGSAFQHVLSCLKCFRAFFSQLERAVCASSKCSRSSFFFVFGLVIHQTVWRRFECQVKNAININFSYKSFPGPENYKRHIWNDPLPSFRNFYILIVYPQHFVILHTEIHIFLCFLIENFFFASCFFLCALFIWLCVLLHRLLS